ncbi:MAG: 3-phosphoshikimate 1-carboxyvinyltransferase [Nitrososphaerota archaeon]|nr:3-phosphoshikimate 1-carboxyvinyltransferase [Candidatus Calditenuaceae archaeon]MDW8074072.1 3-phosphoshikimate 1-carboxyvinyltransferase [Nitrososphaerota archaeon]
MIVRVRAERVSGEVKAPPSKSYTHRAITAALLAPGKSDITNPLYSRDTEATINAAKLFGATLNLKKDHITVEGVERPKTPDNIIDAMNSGTTLRIMTSVAGLTKSGYTVLTGDESLRRRPMQPLLNALRQLGIRAWSSKLDGTAPVIVEGGEMGGECRIRGDVSSQFISGLIIAGSAAERPVSVNIEGELVSKPYIDATLSVLKQFGVEVERAGYRKFTTTPRGYRPAGFTVPGDYGLAGFVMSTPMVAGGRVRVTGLDPRLPQADYKVVEVLRNMGAEVKEGEGFVEVVGSSLRGVDVSLRDSPDLLPIVAVLGAVADGETRIRDVGHARFKESDRIAVLAAELSKTSIRVRELPDGLVVEGGRLKAARLDPRGDHRLFMAFTLLSLATRGGIEVLDPESASVSYPTFLQDLETLGCEVEKI